MVDAICDNNYLIDHDHDHDHEKHARVAGGESHVSFSLEVYLPSTLAARRKVKD